MAISSSMVETWYLCCKEYSVSAADRLYLRLVNAAAVTDLERAYFLAVLTVNAYMHIAISAKPCYISFEVHSAVAVVKPEIIVFIA